MYSLKMVCDKFNITKTAIYYYEEKGLLTIKRNEHGIRIFNEHDLALIHQIVIYRYLDFSIDQIHNLISSYNLNNQMLEEKEKQLQADYNETLQQITSAETLKHTIETSESIDILDYSFFSTNEDYIEDTVNIRLNGNWQPYTIYCTKKEYFRLTVLIRLLLFGMALFMVLLVLYKTMGE